MANSRVAIVIVFLLVLASTQSISVFARMMLSDRDGYLLMVRNGETGAASLPTASHDFRRHVFTTAPPALSSKLMKIAADERRQIIEVDGSVPSPGVGHH
jgi:hypothetical protein